MISAVVLAAGMGTRLNQGQPSKIAKVLYPLADKPMILYTLTWVKKVVDQVILVVHHQKETVMGLVGEEVDYVDQSQPLGTGHAVAKGLEKVSQEATQVLVANGDDSAFYNEDLINKLIEFHCQKEAVLTFITLEKSNPQGLGRILRDQNGKLKGIIEEKEATDEQKKIKEVNDGVYFFEKDWLEENISKVSSAFVTGEFYLTDLVSIALRDDQRVETFQVEERFWHGVNTPEELEEANRLMRELLHD